jgi:hypothetical protein
MALKPTEERSVATLIRNVRQLAKQETELWSARRALEKELNARGWHYNFNHDKRKYEWQPREQEPYEEYRKRLYPKLRSE